MEKLQVIEVKFLKEVDFSQYPHIKKEDVEITLIKSVKAKLLKSWKKEYSEGENWFVDVDDDDIIYVLDGNMIKKLNSIHNKEFTLLEKIQIKN